MKKNLMIFASLLMAGAGFAQDSEAQPQPVSHGLFGAQRPGKPTPPTRPNATGVAGQTKGMRPGEAAERGAQALNTARNQIEGMSMFLESDANKDGIIDEAEAKTAEAKFIELLHQRIKEHNEQMVRRFDKNGDGTLDEQEKAVMRETLEKYRSTLRTKTDNLNELYRRIDKNGNGQISPEELQGFIAGLQKQALPVFFKSFDKNNDGKLEGEELAAALAAMMKKYDHNNDGQLDLQELRPLWREVAERNKELRTEKARPAEEPRKAGGKRTLAPPQPE